MSSRNWVISLTSQFLSKQSARPRRNHTPLAGVEACVLEDRRLLSAAIYVGNAQYQLPAVVNDPGQVLFTGGTAKGQDWGALPQKLLTFTNNSTDQHTIYPFLYSPNTSATRRMERTFWACPLASPSPSLFH